MSNLMRGLVGGAALFGVAGTGVGLYAANAPEQPASQVVVDDGAEILHEPTLREGIEVAGPVRFAGPRAELDAA